MYKQALARLEADYKAGAIGTHELMKGLTGETDALVTELAESCGFDGAGLCVMGLGGYARRQIFPYSDIDLLIIHDGGLDEAAGRAISQFTAGLWDSGGTPGIQLADLREIRPNIDSSDIVHTSYIDNMYLAGSRALYDSFLAALQRQVIRKGRERFLTAKFQEQQKRAELYLDSIYRLEPNVKEGKGGLRDINALWWIAGVYYNVPAFAELERAPFFSGGGYGVFSGAVEFIFRVRTELHYLARRKFDTLRREYQPEVAARMGFAPSGRYSAAENFMREYYRSASVISANVARAMEMARGHMNRSGNVPELRRLPGGLLSYENTLLLPRESLGDMSRLSLLLNQSVHGGQPIHHSMADRLKLFDVSPESRRATGHMLGDMLGQFGYSYQFAVRLLRLGILEVYIPEFSDIMYRTQDNSYHHYTVDEHTFLALDALDRVALGQSRFARQFAGVLSELGRRDLLAMAILLHDIGKSGPSDHAAAGAQMARRIMRHLGYTHNDTELVARLVKNHLLMSHTFQRRDVSNRGEVAAFAAQLGSPAELDMLYLLTYADMSALGGRHFGGWDSALMEELYRRAREYFSMSGKPELFEKTVTARRQALEARLSKLPGGAETLAVIEDETVYAFGIERLVEYAEMAAELQAAGMAVVRIRPLRGTLWRLIVCAMDEPGLLRRIVGALAQSNCNILGATIYTPRRQIIIDTIDFVPPEGADWQDALEAVVKHAIAEPGYVPELRAVKRFGAKKKARPLQVKFDNSGVSAYTVVDIFSGDRRGLLYDILGVFTSGGISVQHAKISTDVDQVVDSFSITVDGKKLGEEQLAALAEALGKIEGGT